MPRVRGAQEFTLPEGATLKQLVEKGLSMSHAGVGTVVRLRKELSLIKDIPVLIAIDDVSLTQPQEFLLVSSSSIIVYDLSFLQGTHEFVFPCLDLQYNSWFVFSQYGVRAKKPIHASKLAMVRCKV